MTENPGREWVMMGQWNMHRQAASPQSLLEQKSHLQSAAAPSPHKRGALFYTYDIKNKTKPEVRNLSQNHRTKAWRWNRQTRGKKVAMGNDKVLTATGSLPDAGR